MTRAPKTVFSNLKSIVGKTSLASVNEILASLHLPYEAVEIESGTIGLKANDVVYTVEEILAMMFGHIRTMGEEDAQSAIKDVVITVPAFYGHRERRAIVDAAELAGLNILSLINDHTAGVS